MRHAILAGLLTLATTAGAHTQEFNFISYNTIRPGHEAAFEIYQDTVRPIMARHGGHYLSADVEDVLLGPGRPGVVNFGTMGNPEQVGSFFNDPDFQAAFPDLVEVLDDHLTLVPTRTLADIEGLPSGTRLLLVTASGPDDLDFMDQIVTFHALGRWQIAMANRGIGPDVTSETPPAAFGVWIIEEMDGLRLNGPGLQSVLLLRAR